MKSIDSVVQMYYDIFRQNAGVFFLMKNRTFRRRCILFLVIALVMMPTLTVYAEGSWRPDDSTIYHAVDNDSGSVLQNAINEITNIAGSLVGGTLGLLLKGLLVAVGDTLNLLLLSAGISLNSVIYGNVGGMSKETGTALFTFELTTGNIYGTVAMTLYNVLLTTFTILLIAVILFRLTTLIYSGSDGKSRAALKETLKGVAISLIAIFLMPKFLDLVLYVRDLVLYTVLNKGTESVAKMMGETTLLQNASSRFFGFDMKTSLVGLYHAAALADGSDFFSSLMYLGTVILTLYFCFIYASMALTLAILVVMFPFVCVVQVATGGRRMQEWFNEVLGIVVAPVIDASLLLFPLAFAFAAAKLGNRPSAFTLIEFALVASIIPARSFMRAKLGFGQASSMERSGLGMAFGAARLAGSLAMAATGIAKDFKKGRKEADAHRDSAEIIQNNEARDENYTDSLVDDTSKKSQDIAKYDDFYKGFDGEKLKGSDTYRGSQKMSKAKQAIDGEREAVGDAIHKHQAAIDKDTVELGRLQGRMRSLSGREQTDDTKAEMREVQQEMSLRNASIEDHRGKISSLRELGGDLDRKSRSLNSIGGDIDYDKRLDLDKKATIDNFNTEEFRNITPERRAQLENELADAKRAQANVRLGTGLAYATGGSAIGAGLTSFFGPTGMTYGISMGLDYGNLGSMSAAEGSYSRFVDQSRIPDAAPEPPIIAAPDDSGPAPVPPMGPTLDPSMFSATDYGPIAGYAIANNVPVSTDCIEYSLNNAAYTYDRVMNAGVVPGHAQNEVTTTMLKDYAYGKASLVFSDSFSRHFAESGVLDDYTILNPSAANDALKRIGSGMFNNMFNENGRDLSSEYRIIMNNPRYKGADAMMDDYLRGQAV